MQNDSTRKEVPQTGCLFYIVSFLVVVAGVIWLEPIVQGWFPSYEGDIFAILFSCGLMGIIPVETFFRERRERRHWLEYEYPLMTKRAEAGNPQDQYELGWAIYVSKPEKQHVPVSFWMLKSAEQGCLNAQVFLIRHYRLDREGNRDLEKSAFWCRKAANQGDAQSQLELASIYEEGRGVPADLSYAIYWYREAASHKGGSEYVKWENSHLYEPPDYSERANLHNSNEYSMQAWRKLGGFYLTGVDGLGRDEIEAYAYWNLAATAYSGGGSFVDSDRKILAEIERKLTRAQIHAGKERTAELREEFKTKRREKENGI